MTNKLKLIQHLTGNQITTLATKLLPFFPTGGFFKLLELHLLVIFALQSKSQGLDKGWKFKN